MQMILVGNQQNIHIPLNLTLHCKVLGKKTAMTAIEEIQEKQNGKSNIACRFMKCKVHFNSANDYRLEQDDFDFTAGFCVCFHKKSISIQFIAKINETFNCSNCELKTIQKSLSYFCLTVCIQPSLFFHLNNCQQTFIAFAQWKWIISVISIEFPTIALSSICSSSVHCSSA